MYLPLLKVSVVENEGVCTLVCVVKTLNVSTCEYIYIFILLSKDVSFLLFSKSNFLTWNLDSIPSQPPLGPKSYNY